MIFKELKTGNQWQFQWYRWQKTIFAAQKLYKVLLHTNDQLLCQLNKMNWKCFRKLCCALVYGKVWLNLFANSIINYFESFCYDCIQRRKKEKKFCVSIHSFRLLSGKWYFKNLSFGIWKLARNINRKLLLLLRTGKKNAPQRNEANNTHYSFNFRWKY